MEIHIKNYEEPESLPYKGFRYCIVIPNAITLTSNYVFDSFEESLAEAIDEVRDFFLYEEE